MENNFMIYAISFILFCIILALVFYILRKKRNTLDIGHDDLFASGIFELSIGEYEKASEIFLKIVKENPEHFHAYLELGNIYRKIGNPTKALEIHYNLSNRKVPHDLKQYLNLSMFYDFFEMKEYSHAIEKLMSLNPKTLKNVDVYDILNTLLDKRKYESAFTLMNRLGIHNNELMNYILIEKYTSSEKEMDDFERHINELWKKNKSNPMTFFYYFSIITEAKNREFEKLLSDTIRTYPHLSFVWYKLALKYMSLDEIFEKIFADKIIEEAFLAEILKDLSENEDVERFIQLADYMKENNITISCGSNLAKILVNKFKSEINLNINLEKEKYFCTSCHNLTEKFHWRCQNCHSLYLISKM